MAGLYTVRSRAMQVFFHFWAFFYFMLGSAAFLSTAFDPLLTQNAKKAGSAGRKQWRNPPSGRWQTAQIGAETAPILL